MVDTIKISYDRVLEQPLEDAYTWLTDYRDDDPERTDAIIEGREVIEEREDEVIVGAKLVTLGREVTGRARVELDPPDTWTAHIEDDKGRPAGRYEYHLEEHPDGCKLEVDYHVATPRLRDKLMLWISKPLARREIDQMWAGFAQAMADELDAD